VRIARILDFEPSVLGKHVSEITTNQPHLVEMQLLVARRTTQHPFASRRDASIHLLDASLRDAIFTHAPSAGIARNPPFPQGKGDLSAYHRMTWRAG